MIAWPGQARCAVMLTFDFDAEALWLSRDPENANRLGTLSLGTFGARVGVPEILRVLRETELPATFFVPGWTAEQHTSKVEAIIKDGHEVGHHSYSHRWVEAGDKAGELEEIDLGLDALKRTVGIVPKGYRAPASEITPGVFQLLHDRGFLYDSSMMDSVEPYQHRLGGNDRALVELPWHWALDDAAYMMFSSRMPRALMTNEHVFSIWSAEFRAIHRSGGLFNLVMHPQFTGRPSRLDLLRQMIGFIQGFPDVWFCRGSEAATAYVAQAA